jgi:predicted amidohydrolase
MNKYLMILIAVCTMATVAGQNPAYQCDFSQGTIGDLPHGWSLFTIENDVPPRFELRKDERGSYLSIVGAGDSLALAYVSTRIKLSPGTYIYKTLFSISADVNPQRHLLYQFNGGSRDGIFKFYKLENGMVEGRDIVEVRGSESRDVELRVYYRFNAAGEVKLRNLSVTPTDPVQPRWARFACTQGIIKPEQMAAVARQAADDSVDLLLYPENFINNNSNPVLGKTLMAEMSRLAALHKIYVAGSAVVFDSVRKRKYNRGAMFDRNGALVGTYDKIHPYSPEVDKESIKPGDAVPVFQTDFGRVAMIICYDSWFTDVTQLLALKGAEVILFPVAGYYRSLIPARAADNGVRFVISVRGGTYGIFDTAGRDVERPDKDPSVGTGGKTFKDVRTFVVDKIGILCASLDLNRSISPHYNGGKMLESPGGKRNRDEQILYLDDLIKREKERWWEND